MKNSSETAATPEKRQKLTNAEAYLVLQEAMQKQKKGQLMSSKNELLTQELLEHLETQPKYKQGSKLVEDLIHNLEKQTLSQFQLMQIINTLPIKEVDLELVVEDSENKLGTNEIEKILELCQQIRDEASQKE